MEFLLLLLTNTVISCILGAASFSTAYNLTDAKTLKIICVKWFFGILSIAHWGMAWSVLILAFDLDTLVLVTIANIGISALTLIGFYGIMITNVKYSVENKTLFKLLHNMQSQRFPIRNK